MTDSEQEDGQPLEIGVHEAFGVIADSPFQRRRLRFLNTKGVEVACLTGLLAGPGWVMEDDKQFVELLVSAGPGLLATVKIALDPDTRCTISPDGTMTGTLPTGAMWTTVPLPTGG